MSDDHDFSANKIFAYLFLYTGLSQWWNELRLCVCSYLE